MYMPKIVRVSCTCITLSVELEILVHYYKFLVGDLIKT